MKDALLDNSPMNVIIVNWTADNQPPYYQAVANARAVGAQVAYMINYHVVRNILHSDISLFANVQFCLELIWLSYIYINTLDLRFHIPL